MDRRTFIGTLAGGFVVASCPVEAQQPQYVPRVGFLAGSSSSNPSLTAYVEAFRQGLHELGYVEGRSILIESRYAEGRSDLLPALAAELLRLKVDIIVTEGTNATDAAKNATRTVPIVMALVGDPVGARLVESLARPGSNITGVTTLAFGVTGKQMALLKEVAPAMTRLAVLWNPSHQPSALAMERVKTDAQSLGLDLQLVEARRVSDLNTAFADISRKRAHGLLTLSTPEFDNQQQRIADFSLQNGLPAIYTKTAFVEAGGLMCYGARYPELFRRAAVYVDKILRGAKPSDLPVEQPTKFELVINIRTAKALGLTVPQSILARADEVIQ